VHGQRTAAEGPADTIGRDHRRWRLASVTDTVRRLCLARRHSDPYR
jgi:hypothetical protein